MPADVDWDAMEEVDNLLASQAARLSALADGQEASCAGGSHSTAKAGGQQRRQKLGVFMDSDLGPVVASKLAAAHDFVVVCSSSTPASPNSPSLGSLLSAVAAGGARPMAKVAGPDDSAGIEHAVALGARGIVVPGVCRASEAQAVAQQLDRVHAILQRTSDSAENVALTILVDSERCVGSIAAIAAVPGIDILFVSDDLPQSMGVRSDILSSSSSDDEMAAAIDRVVKHAEINGKTLGIGLSGPGRMLDAIQRGFSFISIDSVGGDENFTLNELRISQEERRPAALVHKVPTPATALLAMGNTETAQQADMPGVGQPLGGAEMVHITARRGDLGTPLIDAARTAVPLLRGADASLGPRPRNLNVQDGAADDEVERPQVLFRESSAGTRRRYSRNEERSADVWKTHGGTSITTCPLPAPWQQEGLPQQQLVRRSGKIEQPDGLPLLRFHKYTIRPGGEEELYHVLPGTMSAPPARNVVTSCEPEENDATGPAESAFDRLTGMEILTLEVDGADPHEEAAVSPNTTPPEEPEMPARESYLTKMDWRKSTRTLRPPDEESVQELVEEYSGKRSSGGGEAPDAKRIRGLLLGGMVAVSIVNAGVSSPANGPGSARQLTTIGEEPSTFGWLMPKRFLGLARIIHPDAADQSMIFLATLAMISVVFLCVLLPLVRPIFLKAALKRGAQYSQKEMEESISASTKGKIFLCSCSRFTQRGVMWAGRTARHNIIGLVCTTAVLNLVPSEGVDATIMGETLLGVLTCVAYFFTARYATREGGEPRGSRLVKLFGAPLWAESAGVPKVLAANALAVVGYGVCGELAHVMVFGLAPFAKDLELTELRVLGMVRPWGG